MSRKFSIVRAAKIMDFDKASNEIYEYIMCNGERPYLFMHTNTMQAILAALQSTLTMFDSFYCKKTFEGSDVKGLYEGCKVFIDNNLEFGEVEIR